MQIQARSGGDERAILTAMVTDAAVLARVASQWAPEGLFASKHANLVGGWAVSYYNRYGKAPGKEIELQFERWQNKGKRDADTVKLAEQLLTHLSREYSRKRRLPSSEYIIDLAGQYFNDIRKRRLIDDLQASLDAGDNEGDRILTDYGRVELGVGAGIDPMHDASCWEAAFAEPPVALVTYPGALGEFYGNTLCRDAFVAFAGPSKRGKSFVLMDIAFRAMQQRRRTIFFECGDNSEGQWLTRWGARAARKPLHPCTVRVPTSIAHDHDLHVTDVITKTKTFTDGLTAAECIAACDNIMRKQVRSTDSYIRLSAHHNSSLTVQQIETLIQTWSRDGWVPDVIIIDYADILAPPAGARDEREEINTNWKHMRRLSQRYHCLVVTATQTDAASYDASLIKKKHFSGDRRKHDHVTAMVGLNQSHAEYDDEIMRLNYLDRRAAQSNELHCVYTAGCKAIANPFIVSCW